MQNTDKETFSEILEKLGIKEYAQRIINSNSKGELGHLIQYRTIYEIFNKHPKHLEKSLKFFKEWFEGLVKWAEKTWERPESVFQHVLKQLQHTANQRK